MKPYVLAVIMTLRAVKSRARGLANIRICTVHRNYPGADVQQGIPIGC
jgi:hypothetical protein